MATLKPVLSAILLMVAAALLATGVLGAEAAKEPDSTWAWPGPTPTEIRDALVRKQAHPAFSANEQELKKIEEIAPDKPTAKPLKPRKLLVWGRRWAYVTNALTEAAVGVLGKKTGAFETVASDDPQMLLPERLKEFDAILFLGSYRLRVFLPPWDIKTMPQAEQDAALELERKVKASVLAFAAEEGKGIVGIESSLHGFRDWTGYHELMGATPNGEYVGKFTIKVEEPSHPLTAFLAAQPFVMTDQSYPPGPPYSRKNVRVLLSLDPAQNPDPTADPKMAWLKEDMKRQTQYTGKAPDYPLSWIKSYGKGRSIYLSLGVHKTAYLHPLFLRYLLNGIQFATGDLPADTTPSEK